MTRNNNRARQALAMDELERTAAANLPNSTTAGLTDDYANDTRLCLTCVAFVPEPVRTNIVKSVVEPLREKFSDHHFYAAESLHLTVQNVRKVDAIPNFSEADIATVGDAFAEIFRTQAHLNFELDGYLKLPSSVAIRAFADERFQHLVSLLREGLVKLGLPDDKFYIDPNLVFGNITFCRFRSVPNDAMIEALTNLQFSMTMAASEISLITTNVACHPRHTKVWRTFKLDS